MHSPSRCVPRRVSHAETPVGVDDGAVSLDIVTDMDGDALAIHARGELSRYQTVG
ncbi:MAG: hypothetical protein AAFY28_02175 [Actinomycetota bacterium]